MAQVTSDPATAARARIEDFLEYLMREWLGVPNVVRAWDEWDEFSRLVFQEDWAVREDRLAQLRRCSAQGQMTSEQETRYQQLLQVVAEQRPVLARLFAGS